MWQARDWQSQIERDRKIHRYVTESTTQTALDALDVQSGDRVLVAGCGYGREALLLRERCPGAEVQAIDQSPNMVRAAQDNGIDAETADITALPFPDNHFERVLCYGVLMHVDGDRKALEQLARVTAPGGVLVWTFNHRLSPASWAMWAIWKLRGTAPNVRQQFRSGGYWRSVIPNYQTVGGSFIPGIGPDWAYPFAAGVSKVGGAVLPRYETVARWRK